MTNIHLLALAALAGVAQAQAGQCSSGKIVPDLGYGVVACNNCLSSITRNGVEIARYTAEPALYSIRSGGPAAGRINEGDTLVSVAGAAIASEQAAIRLSEWRNGPLRLVLRRNGSTRSVSVTPLPVCVGSGNSPLVMAQMTSQSTSQQSAVRGRDSLERDRTIELYRARAITRREFESRVGLVRADSIIRADPAARARGGTPGQPHASPGQVGLEAILEQQFRAARTDTALLRAQLEQASAALRSAALRNDVSERLALQRMADAIRGLATNSVLAANVSLPSTSLGMGLLCDECGVETLENGRAVWTFKSLPVVGGVEAGSLADRLGLRQGDTLQTIDGFSVTTRAGGERLGAMSPGKTLTLTWRHDGVSHSASVTLPAGSGVGAAAPGLTQSVGNARVEVSGQSARWTRDPATGALRITAAGITVTITPPPHSAARAARDTTRRGAKPPV
jgi:hypothetical protein